MSEHDLSTLLHDRLTALEPPLRLTPGDTIAAGRRRRARRAGLVALATVTTAGLVTALSVGGHLTPDRTTVAVDSGPTPVEQAILDAVARAYVPHLGALPDEPVTGTDDHDGNVPLGSPAMTGIGVKYELPGRHTVTLGMNSGAPLSITNCQEWKRHDTAVACSVRTLPDGSTVMTSVLAFGPPGSPAPDLPTILDSDMLAEADPSTLLWSHGEMVRTPDGDIVGAYEMLPAPSYDAARAAWQLPDSALLAAVTDPALTGYDFP